MDVIHTAVWVSDLDATKEFYIDHLGLDHSRDFETDDGATNYFVKGEGHAELQFKHDPDDAGPVDPGDFDHFAVSVDDVDAMVEHVVEETDGDLRSGPRDAGDGVRVAFIEDTDGYGIELIEGLD